MKRFLATTALLMLPIAAIADGMDEDRIKELVLEAIRENPGIVFEAAHLFEQQQQALRIQNNEDEIMQRDRAIQNIESTVADVAEIMQDLAVVVHTHDRLLDGANGGS